ncbi:hypothetical protein K431DRAFT_287707, partial [Polychaeton citri CBS 116435]
MADAYESANDYQRELEAFIELASLNHSEDGKASAELRNSPLLTSRTKQLINSKSNGPEDQVQQYGLLGHHVGGHKRIEKHQPVLLNVQAPQSIFLCGSQGSGKSYTLSCILENCLLPDVKVGRLKRPLCGLAFHWDKGSGDVPAEVAGLCSQGVNVRVLVSTSRSQHLDEVYERIPGASKNLEITPLLFRDTDLSI